MAVRGVQYIRTITMPFKLTELSPLNNFFLMVGCSYHILESTRGIEIKLDTYIDVNERKYRRQ